MSSVRLRTAAAALALLAGGAAAAAGDAEVLARFRKAFEGDAPAAERAAVAREIGFLDSRPAAELVCRGLGSTLDRIEALASRRTALREELLSLAGEDDGKEQKRWTAEIQKRVDALRIEEERLREEDAGERAVAGTLRDGLVHYRDPKALEAMAAFAGKAGAPGAARAAVAEVLGGAGDPSVARALRGLLRDRDPAVREAALGALASLQAKEEETRKALAAALADERWTVRLEAARRLADLATPEAVDLLVARMPLEDGRLRRDFGDLLGGLTGQRFGEEPDGWAHWWRDNRASFASGASTLTRGGTAPRPEGEEGFNYYGIRTPSKRILYVLDVSGSMERPGGGTPPLPRVEGAKRELLRSLGTLPPGSAFTVYAFHDTVNKWKPGLQRATPEAKEEIRRWVGALGAASWTNTYAALEEAIRASAADPRNNMGEDYAMVADTIFLLTDGAPTTPGGGVRDAKGKPETARVIEAVRAWNREKRVVIHCVGVGPEINSDFLSTLAHENGGDFVAVR